jgi:predicted transcriptional regulator
MRDRAQEDRLLASIAQRGIEEPLEGVDTQQASVLLNGFKRYRCARKLGIETVRYMPLSHDEAMGIVGLLRESKNKALTILEQAGFVDELHKRHAMSVAEIAEELSRSKAWVSMRLGLIGRMSPTVREKLFAGAFPVYSYMYILRQFMRMNEATKTQIEEFVAALSGKKLSLREIEQLAHGYFRGPESFREQIRSGNIAVSLGQLDDVPEDPEGYSDFERALLKDLGRTQKYMQRVMGKCQDKRLKSRAFHAQAHLLSAGIIQSASAFIQTLRQLHDRSGKA